MSLSPHRPGRQWLRIGVTATSAVAAALFGATAAHATTDTPAAQAANPQSLEAVQCDYNGASNQWMTRSDAVTRARSWVGKTPYSMYACYRNAYGDYRTDCSGMVSMAWGLGGRGSDWWTGNLDQVSTPIPAAQLQAGDALLYHDGTPNNSHVALFVRWADSAQTRPVVIQETGSADNTIEGEPTNFNWRNYTPIRYDRIVDDAATMPDAGRSVQARADVNGDGKADFVSMYDYGGFQTKLLVGLSTGSSVPAPAVWFDSGAGGWDWSRNKIAVADFTGDGKADVGALYDYGGLQAKLFVFRSTGTGFAAPALWWDSGVGGWDWSRSTMAVGDYNGDGKADLGVLYDYGSLRTKLLVGLSTGTSMPAPQAWWDSGTGGWDYARSKIATGDYNGDGKTDLGVLYDYGSLQTKLLVGLSTGNAMPAPQAWWNSGVGGWDYARSKPVVADYNGDGKSDLAVVYDYGSFRTKLLIGTSTGTSVPAPAVWWDSGAGGWDYARTKV